MKKNPKQIAVAQKQPPGVSLHTGGLYNGNTLTIIVRDKDGKEAQHAMTPDEIKWLVKALAARM